jgi:hypothetical protein
MRSLVFQVVTLLVAATAGFSQNPAAAVATSESQKDEQQIRQVEAEMLQGEMNSDPAIFEKILADDCVNWPAGPGLTKARLVEGIRKAQGQAPPYTASDEDMRVYMLGDTAIAMYVKEYAVRANPNQVDSQDLTDVFVRSADTWKLKISRASPHRRTES